MFPRKEFKEYIEEVSRELRGAPRRGLKSLIGGLDVIAMAYSAAPERQFLLEYLQNAIDARATAFYVKVDIGKIIIANNGVPFSKDDVDAICGIACSRKKPEEGLIGFIGIGAKSAFLLGKRLEIHSGEYHFAFDKDFWEEDMPWQILPIPTKCYDEQCIYVNEKYKTVFVLEKFHKGEIIGNLSDIMFNPRNPFFIDSRVLLFTHAYFKGKLTLL